VSSTEEEFYLNPHWFPYSNLSLEWVTLITKSMTSSWKVLSIWWTKLVKLLKRTLPVSKRIKKKLLNNSQKLLIDLSGLNTLKVKIWSQTEWNYWSKTCSKTELMAGKKLKTWTKVVQKLN
jgi:hypothetical protein